MQEELTPALKQFLNIKKDYPKSILLFRMGDFYECFFEDAKTVSETLNITLTKRGTKAQVPLAGIPYHALNTYLKKLINAGKTVTIIEQVEDPKLAKGRIVKREVVRTVTPGTIIDDIFLDSKTNNYLLSLFKSDKIGVCFLDISTGEFFVFSSDDNSILTDLMKINPSEILIPDSFDSNLQDTISKLFSATITEQPFIYFSKDYGEEKIKDVFKILSLNTFDLQNNPEIISCVGALLHYIEHTQKTKLKNVLKIKFFNKEKYLMLDAHTIKNLDLLQNSEGNNKNTLLNIIDFTKTAMGSRLMKKNLVLPLKQKEDIEYRLNIINSILNLNCQFNISDYLSKIGDIERITSKIIYSNASPRDLIALKQSIFDCLPLQNYIKELDICGLDINVDTKLIEFANLINSAIIDECPANFKEGNFIKKGFNKDLDELLNIKSNLKDILLEMETKEKEKTGIKTLRIGYNKIFGFFFELPKSQSNELPAYFVRKQTLANNERVITEELKLLENNVLGSEEKARNLELELFTKITEDSKELAIYFYDLAREISELDFFNSLAICAVNNNYSKPEINNEKKLFIKNGRHPIIEKIEQEKFIANDLYMDNNSENILIITGPNMAGKSTYLRQNALIILLAHLGSYVPCDSSNICTFDRLFTRIGASDNLALGLSTFMVEMVETANILNNATDDSFIILDEIGRGTSTYDGMSIASSILEYLYTKVRAKTLFATHYHQLMQLESNYKGIKNYHISAKEVDGNLIFLRKIESGPLDKSYGISVAKLAGLPEEVISRAKEIEYYLDKKSEDLKIMPNEKDFKIEEHNTNNNINNININTITNNIDNIETNNIVEQKQKTQRKIFDW